MPPGGQRRRYQDVEKELNFQRGERIHAQRAGENGQRSMNISVGGSLLRAVVVMVVVVVAAAAAAQLW